MPGGDWLPSWISVLGATPIVVGRAGLGTLNHTILTVEALRSLELPPPAFLLNCRHPQSLETIESNRRVLEARLQIPCLGVLPHASSNPDAERDEGWLTRDALTRLEA
jgi:dethiobiotin synthetase